MREGVLIKDVMYNDISGKDRKSYVINEMNLINLGIAVSIVGLLWVLVYLKMIVTIEDILCYTLAVWITIMILTTYQCWKDLLMK